MAKASVSISTFVGAIIENDKKDILLQKRDNKAPTFKNCWTLFGGKVEKGESAKKALLRELEEEISLPARSIQECKIIQKNRQKNGSIQYVFLVKTEVTTKELILKEGKEMKFIKRSNLLSRKFAFNIYEVLEKYLKIKRVEKTRN